jgi:hypothetical protein
MKKLAITLASIASLLILGALAITHGIDRGVLIAAVAALAGLGGYELGIHRKE